MISDFETEFQNQKLHNLKRQQGFKKLQNYQTLSTH